MFLLNREDFDKIYGKLNEDTNFEKTNFDFNAFLHELHKRPVMAGLNDDYELKDFCSKYKDDFSFVGNGSSRIAFILKDGRCLKIAKNQAGIDQNKQEAENFGSNDYSCFSKLYELDNQKYRAMIVECGTEIKKRDLDFIYDTKIYIDNLIDCAVLKTTTDISNEQTLDTIKNEKTPEINNDKLTLYVKYNTASVRLKNGNDIIEIPYTVGDNLNNKKSLVLTGNEHSKIIDNIKYYLLKYKNDIGTAVKKIENDNRDELDEIVFDDFSTEDNFSDDIQYDFKNIKIKRTSSFGPLYNKSAYFHEMDIYKSAFIDKDPSLKYKTITDLSKFYSQFGFEKLLTADITSERNWAIVKRNNQSVPVIIDAGFSSKVSKKHYGGLGI